MVRKRKIRKRRKDGHYQTYWVGRKRKVRKKNYGMAVFERKNPLGDVEREEVFPLLGPRKRVVNVISTDELTPEQYQLMKQLGRVQTDYATDPDDGEVEPITDLGFMDSIMDLMGSKDFKLVEPIGPAEKQLRRKIAAGEIEGFEPLKIQRMIKSVPGTHSSKLTIDTDDIDFKLLARPESESFGQSFTVPKDLRRKTKLEKIT